MFNPIRMKSKQKTDTKHLNFSPCLLLICQTCLCHLHIWGHIERDVFPIPVFLESLNNYSCSVDLSQYGRYVKSTYHPGDNPGPPFPNLIDNPLVQRWGISFSPRAGDHLTGETGEIISGINYCLPLRWSSYLKRQVVDTGINSLILPQIISTVAMVTMWIVPWN